MTRISTVCLLTGTLAAFALSANGASAVQVVTVKVHMPKVTVNTPKPKTGGIGIKKETDSTTPKLTEKTLNENSGVDAAPLQKIVDSPTKSKTGTTKSPKTGGVVIKKVTDPTTAPLYERVFEPPPP
jgi:hypothetical protein